MKGHFRRARGVAALAVVVLCFGGISQSASAWPGTGFTGELWWSCLPPEGYECGLAQVHSYGFTSAQYSGNGNWAIYARIRGTPLGDYTTYVSDPVRLARVCTNGNYPNCTDYDGYSAHSRVGNYIYTHTLDGHGVY